MIGTESLAGGDEDFSSLAIDGKVVDFVADEWGVLCGEVLDGLHPVGTQQIDAVVECSHPFAVAAIDEDALDGDAVQQVVAQS